jgi:hypothetical protein
MSLPRISRRGFVFLLVALSIIAARHQTANAIWYPGTLMMQAGQWPFGSVCVSSDTGAEQLCLDHQGTQSDWWRLNVYQGSNQCGQPEIYWTSVNDGWYACGSGSHQSQWADAGDYCYAVYQSDGNLVLRTSSGTAVWSTNTSGYDYEAFLEFSDYGNLIVYYDAYIPVWSIF